MQIVVKTLAGESIALEVQSADTTEYVKAKVLHASASSPGGNAGVSPYQRYCLVSAAGEQLERGRTLADHGIVQDGATLDLVLDPEPPMQILVKMVNLEEFTVDVHGSDTMFAVMAKIQREQGIPASMQRLVANRQRLASGRTLASFGVEDKSAIFCVLALGSSRLSVKQWMVIFVEVEAPAGDDWEGRKGFDVEVETTDTVGVVKERIELQQGIPASQQRLVLLDGKQMDDGVVLTEYGVRDKSGIRLLLRRL